MVGPALSTQGLIQGSHSSSWSQFSEEDKFFYKATANSIADINAFTCQKDTSFVTIGTTDDFIIGKYGWFYEGCNNCTKRRPDVDNDAPFMCQCKVYNQKSIPRYKLELKIVENCHTTRMIFWDDQCKQLLGVKAAELRKTMVDEGEEDPRAYPELLDKMLNRRMAIKVKLQPGYATGSVQKVSESEEMLQAVLDKIGPLEAEVIQSIGETSEIPEPNESVHFITQSLSATADHDPEQVDSVTLAKRGSLDDMPGQDLASAQLSSTKMAKRIKTE